MFIHFPSIHYQCQTHFSHDGRIILGVLLHWQNCEVKAKPTESNVNQTAQTWIRVLDFQVFHSSRTEYQHNRPQVMTVTTVKAAEAGGWLTADLQVHGLVGLTDGVAGGAEVLAGVRELDVFQGERGHPCVAAYHDVSIQALQQRRDGDYSHFSGNCQCACCSSMRLFESKRWQLAPKNRPTEKRWRVCVFNLFAGKDEDKLGCELSSLAA